MGPVGCLWVLSDSWIGLPLRLVSRPPLADDSFPSLRIRRLSDYALGDEREQFRLSHRPSRRRAESHLHGTLSARPPSHVLRRCSHAALHAFCAWLLVGASRLPRCHPFDRPPPPPRRKDALPRPPGLFRLLPPYPVPPSPSALVTSLGGARRRAHPHRRPASCHQGPQHPKLQAAPDHLARFGSCRSASFCCHPRPAVPGRIWFALCRAHPPPL